MSSTDQQPAPWVGDAPYLLWVNDDRTVLVRWWANGLMEVATRPEAGAIWGPPTTVKPEAT